MRLKLFFFIIIFSACNIFKNEDPAANIPEPINPIESDLLQPEFNETVNSTHVLFEWKQQQFADSYLIEICRDSDYLDCINTENSNSLIKIFTNLEWNTQYHWRVKSIFSSNPTENWIDSSQFRISEKLGNAYTNISSEHSEGGITMFGSFFDFYSAAIDAQGNEIWNTGNSQFVFYSMNSHGQFFGSQYNPNLENNLPGIEFNSQNKIIWQEPNDHFLHHELIQLPNGNYMGIVEDIQYGPIPNNGNWTSLFQGIGFVADGQTIEFKWVGDRIVEWDEETGEEVWSWSTFDYYNMDDYDIYGGTWMEAYQANRYDWTHANAFAFDENENAIYLSSRHLSRITKIDYMTKEIIWNMGIEHGSGDVNFGEDLQFSFQHSLQILPNGNLVILDNGNLSQSLFETEYPTSRGLEIHINGNENAEIIWEYVLPENLFGFASGNVQKLDNGNYLITTVGDGGTSLEVSSTNEIVWEVKYNLTLPAGAVYRAQRIQGLFAGIYSFILPKEIDFENNILSQSDINNELEFIIINESNYTETFQFELSTSNGSISNQSIEIELAPQEEWSILIPCENLNDNEIDLYVAAIPLHFPHYAKSHQIQIINELTNSIESQNLKLDK